MRNSVQLDGDILNMDDYYNVYLEQFKNRRKIMARKKLFFEGICAIHIQGKEEYDLFVKLFNMEKYIIPPDCLEMSYDDFYIHIRRAIVFCDTFEETGCDCCFKVNDFIGDDSENPWIALGI